MPMIRLANTLVSGLFRKTASRFGAVTTEALAHAAVLPRIQGFVDEISNTHVTGWVRDRLDPKTRVKFELALIYAEETRVIARGRADIPYPPLGTDEFGEAKCGFKIALPRPLTAREREHLAVRPAGSDITLPRAPKIQGFVDKRTTRNIVGWMRNRFDPAERIDFEIVLAAPDEERILGQGRADIFSPALAQQGIGDARYGFEFVFNPPLTEAERDDVFIRPAGTADFLELSPRLDIFAPTPAVRRPAARPPQYQGFVDEISDTHVIGWVFDQRSPDIRVQVEAIIDQPAETRSLGHATADQDYPALAGSGFGDSAYGFKIPIGESLTPQERDCLAVLPAKSKKPLDRAPKYQGFVDERSLHHVAGWVRNRFNQSERVVIEAVLVTPAGEQSLGKATAESFYPPLAQQSIGDGCYGFQLFYPAPVTEAERDAVIVRPLGAPAALEVSPNVKTSFELLSFVAMDIVNNCNLRCPFCLFDYKDTKSTKFMSEETFDAALRLIPHAGDGNFWLSCLHEPSLHPDFLRLIERIPRQWRRKVMFTTNLAKRMPDSYFESLAASGVHHINVSVESLVPEIFERMRKGARFRIFQENWDKMIAAWKAAAAPPKLRYIMMAYRSNKAEIPGLVKYLREERCGQEVEIRYTYDMEHIPADFRAAEYLLDEDWDWLAEQLAIYPADEVLLTPPVKPLGDEPQQGMVSVTADQLAEYLAESTETLAAAAPAAAAAAGAAPAAAAPPTPAAPGPETAAPAESQPAPEPVPAGTENHAINLPLNVQVEWDGKLVICGKWDHPSERRLAAVININDLSDPYYYLAKLPSRPKIQGFVDELTPTEVTGWVRNLLDPRERVSVEAVLTSAEGTRVVAHGRADQLYKPLLDSPFGDARYGFTLSFPQPLTAAECETLQVRPSHDTIPLDRSPKYQGYVDERSLRHVRGWVRNRFDPAERVTVEAVIPSPAGEEILWTGRADRYDEDIARHAVGDARYGFRFEFDQPLTEAERDSLIIRPAGDPTPLELSPRLVSVFKPDQLTAA